MGFQGCFFPFVLPYIAGPVILVLVGLGLISGWIIAKSRTDSTAQSSGTGDANTESQSRPKRLFRSKDQRVISGLCGGLGEHFKIDPTIVRILWILFGITSFGFAVLLYVILIFAIPEEPIS
ncbi:hypothetical protein CEE37_11700 [candidate division LCP-89 bacterium B3_LCP]|uniref:Phage shock protein PspC N-terminal domain-containing protein n=1 Tax=candidate division LCP-89 bacterium B3_LCP TaxID=2012998 RepID=A0A532UW50_UNCL8|nr:MAG: hypothetical protein CEE37_11700 [candidate division LCP-89 bacterium B3_LCP]